MLPLSDCRFDRELVDWFSRRGGAWSGTASELLASLGTSTDADSSLSPQSPVGLYTHLQSHRQILQSLGVDVLLHNGVPRMVSLRQCQDEPQRKPPSSTLDIAGKSDPTSNLSPPITGRKGDFAVSINAALAGSEAFNRDSSKAKPDSADKFAAGRPADEKRLEENFSLNTGEALFAIVEMRRQVREQGLDLEATVDLIIGRAQAITRCYGIAVGFLPQEIGYQFRPGQAASRNALAFDANFFESRLVAGEAVQITDAQKHPSLGAKYRREGVGSLIIVPIFRNREVAGAIEFFFREKRFFSPGDVMDLGLIAGVVSESLGCSKHMSAKCASDSATEEELIVNLDPLGSLLNDEANPPSAAPAPAVEMNDPEILVPESATPESVVPGLFANKLTTAPAQIWRNFKRAWSRDPRKL